MSSSLSLSYVEKELDFAAEMQDFALRLIEDQNARVMRVLDEDPNIATLEVIATFTKRVNDFLRKHNDRRQRVEADITNVVQKSLALLEQRCLLPVSTDSTE